MKRFHNAFIQGGSSLISLLLANALMLWLCASALTFSGTLLQRWHAQSAYSQFNQALSLTTLILQHSIEQAGSGACHVLSSMLSLPALYDCRQQQSTCLGVNALGPPAAVVLDVTDEGRMLLISSALPTAAQWVIADCEHAEYVTPGRMTKCQQADCLRLQLTRPLRFEYGGDALLYPLNNHEYHAKQVGASDYLMDHQRRLVPHVQQLQLLYRQQPNARFVSARDVTDWQAVDAVIVSVVMRSNNNRVTRLQRLLLWGKPWSAPDRYLYKSFDIAVALQSGVGI